MSDEKKLLAALGYPIWIIAIVLLLTEKADKHLRMHHMQATILGVAALCVWICASIIGTIFAAIPIIGWGIASIIWLLLSLVMLGWFIYAIVCGINCYNGKEVNIPYVTKMAKKHVK